MADSALYSPWFASGDPAAMGWMLAAAQPDSEDLAAMKDAASAQLAAKMRQQSPNVPAPNSGLSGQDFNARFSSNEPAPGLASNDFNSRFGSLAPNVGPPMNIAPDDAQLPPNATPTVGTVPPQMQKAPPGALDRLGSALGGIASPSQMMAMAAGFLGAPSIGIGASRAFQAGAPYAQQNQTVQALINRKIPPDLAQLAASNPQALNQILPQIMGVKQQQFTQIGEDMYGNKRFGFVDPVRGTITPFNGSANNNEMTPDVANLHGEDYLKTLDPARADLIRSIGQGRQAFPSGMMLKTPYGAMLQTQVTQAYPDVNAQTFPQRQKAFNDWYGGGRDQEAVRSVTQASTHALDLIGSMQRLGNYSFGGALVNKPLNEIGNAIGTNTEYGPTQLNVHALADELSKIWKGGTNSDTEVRAWEEKFPVNGTPEQQKAAMGKALELYRGGIDSLERKRQEALGPVANTLPPVLDPKTQSTLAQMETWVHGGSGHTPATASQSAPTAPPSSIPQYQVGQIYNSPKYGAVRYLGPNKWQQVNANSQ